MTDHATKIAEIKGRHALRQAKIDKAASDAADGNNLAALCHGRSPEHEDRATLLEIVAELERSPIPVKPIDKSGYCILCEQNARDRDTERARADKAEAALAAARDKVNGMTAVDNAIDRGLVLAALGVES